MKNEYDFAKNNGHFQGWGQPGLPNESVSKAAKKASNKPASKLKGLETDYKDKETAERRCACENSYTMSALLCMQ